ncbi:MAG: glycosyltransferase family 4 protein [Gammaproteobacteria bacterium]
MKPLTVMQLVPELEVGGVERGTVEIAAALVGRGHRALVVSGGGRLVSELDALGAEHLRLGIGEKRLGSLHHVRRLAALMQAQEVDVVHARSRLPAWLGWLARRRLPADRRPAWVTTVHGPYTVNRYSRIMVSGETVIAISEFIADYVTQNYPAVSAARIRVIPRGVDPARYPHGYQPGADWLRRWREEQPALAGRTLITLPGRLTRWKGQLDFLRLVAELRQRGRDVHGLLAGSTHPRRPDFEQELRETAARLGIADRLSFLGSRDDLREILAVSAIACSLTNEPEAFGRTTIEALSLGTPVVGYDHGGTGEILAHLLPAGRVPVGDVARAADCCEAFLDDAPAVPASHPYTVAAMQTATLEVYAALAARRDAAQAQSA